MKSRCAGLASRAVGVVAVAIASVIISAAPATAQQGPPPPIERPDPSAEMRDRRHREAALRGAELAPGKRRADPRRSEQLIEQVREDYKRLQVIRNEMVRALTSDKPLDYKRIADRSAEINKRASRLKDALALQSPAEELKRQSPTADLNAGQLRDALVNLCNGIITFVENPTFKSPGVADVQEINKAGRLLHNIIDLSNGIGKNAAKLSKN